MASSYPTMLIALRGGGTCSSSSIRSSIGISKTTIMTSVSSSTSTTLKRRREATTIFCTGDRSSSSSSRLLSTSNNVKDNTFTRILEQRRGVSSSSSSATSPIVTALVSPIKLAEFFDRQSAAASAASSLLCSSASSLSSTSSSSVPTGFNDILDPSHSHTHLHSHTHPPTLLCMDIQRHQMSFAVVKHPQFHDRHHDDEVDKKQQHDQDILVVPSPIHTKERKILSSTIDTMWDIVQRYRVCGMIVHWPIEYDTGGKMGAKCGRTLYTLEKLQQESIVSSTDRPVCLFPHRLNNNNNTTAAATVASSSTSTYIDKWGRCAGYGRTRPVMEDLVRNNNGWCDGVVEEDAVGGGDEQPIYYYYHALRNRYYDPIHMVSSGNRPIQLWKEFRDQSWSSSYNMTSSSAEQQRNTMMVSGSGDGVVHKDVSDAKLVVDAKRSNPRPNWTQPKPRRHRIKYHRKNKNKNNLFVDGDKTNFDDEIEDDMDDDRSIDTHMTTGRSSSSSSSSSKTNKSPTKHLFVDRELRVAAAA